MSNLTFDSQLIRAHPLAPLEGHTVVVLERVGEAGERFHSLLEPGGEGPGQGVLAALTGEPGRYFAFAVETSGGMELELIEHVRSRDGGRGFDLEISLGFAVADPRLLVASRNSDPLQRVADRVGEVMAEEVSSLPWPAVSQSFEKASELVISRTQPALAAFAGEYGISITELRLARSTPDRAGDSTPDRAGDVTRLEHDHVNPGPVAPARPDKARRWLDEVLGRVQGVVEGVRARRDVPEAPPEESAPSFAPPSAPPTTPAAPPPSLAPHDVLYRVWYATNRRPVGTGATLGYGGRLDERVNLGSCDVVIPATHRMGELGSPWIRRFLTRTDDRLRLHAVVPLEPEAFWTGVRDVASSYPADKRHALVFLHGYRVSFKDAALRAAQLGYDLGIKGPVAFFGWPSRATVLGYPADGSAVEASERAITDFLLDFARNCGAERVHVIAHSMGNRPLLRALQRILAAAESVPQVRFGHLVLAAPDVTRALFLDVADQYRRLAQRTTLYVSNEDNALRVSHRLQGDRVGLAPPFTCAEGIDTVHVGNVDRTMLGHSTFAEARPVLTDIRALLNFNASPGDRGLDERKQGNDRYWEFRR